jgi:hypothetical protein
MDAQRRRKLNFAGVFISGRCRAGFDVAILSTNVGKTSRK